ncbi:MAG: Maf-like protein [Rhodobacter sp.]|uniref:Maf family protein n=1 Tax=Pararhodobacter sp. TaxID=2127056 RepID=UPI001D89656E|nr:nucleoside triphosphate pyrophosphatase [Pararhodobacter sp.]MCB1345990.1 Maf-like protein [Paracoccaceae bacterium]MCC0072350.1 Maf-like protein [Rhodobacter sp.]HPD91881.1 nucleoside triphosphate pyrophosphatase [Pararhodobacter sp.]
MTVLTLASGSSVRATLLRNAGVAIDVRPARIDEENLRDSLLAEGATPHDLADALAEHKALKIAPQAPLVLGCDQILECDGRIYSKPSSPQDALAQLADLRGKTHRLHTAAVLYAMGEPVWRHVATPRLTMRAFSDAFLQSYVATQWDQIRHCVGCYQIEGAGLRLFDRIEGDLFSIQGLPLLELLSILTLRKDIDG